jgi:large subunit ribosomal protein L9
MKVILLQDIPKVGKKYEVKNVKDGFARNFLFPRNLAEVATPRAVKEIEIRQKQAAQKRELEENLLIQTITGLENKTISYKTKAGKIGQLFDKIDVKDIQEALKK